MAKTYSIPEFKNAFQKPPRPKKVKAQEKDQLEDAVKNNDPVIFRQLAENLYNREPEYFIKLMGYKLGKHLSDNKSNFWLNQVPDKALESLISQNEKKENEFKTFPEMKTAFIFRKLTSGKSFGQGVKDETLQEQFALLDESQLTAVAKALYVENEGNNFVVNTLFDNLSTKNLIVCAKAIFTKEVSKVTVKPEISTEEQKKLDREQQIREQLEEGWLQVASIEDTTDIEQLSLIAEKLNGHYETLRSTLKDFKESNCVTWSGVLMNKIYELRIKLWNSIQHSTDDDEEARKKKETAQTKFREQFESTKQFDRQLSQLGIHLEDNDPQVKLIKERLEAFGDDMPLFDGVTLPNDCGDFANKFLQKLKKSPQTMAEPKKILLSDLQQFINGFPNEYANSGGVVKIRIKYDEQKAICPHHYRTVIGKIGDKYVTYEANVGKKFLLAPEVMILSLDDLFCGNDPDAINRELIDLHWLPPGTTVGSPDTKVN